MLQPRGSIARLRRVHRIKTSRRKQTQHKVSAKAKAPKPGKSRYRRRDYPPLPLLKREHTNSRSLPEHTQESALVAIENGWVHGPDVGASANHEQDDNQEALKIEDSRHDCQKVTGGASLRELVWPATRTLGRKQAERRSTQQRMVSVVPLLMMSAAGKVISRRRWWDTGTADRLNDADY